MEEKLTAIVRKQVSGSCELFIGNFVPWKNSLSNLVTVIFT